MRDWVKRIRERALRTQQSSRAMLLLSVLVVVVIWQLVPYGRQILYPFTLLATWVHEMGHGLTALAVGGDFHRLKIFMDASGVAMTSSPGRVASAAVSLGGLLAPPVVGAAMLATARTPARAQVVLGTLAVLLGGSLVLWVRSLVGLVAVLLLAALVGVVAWFGGRLAVFTAQVVGVLLALDTVTRIDYLFTRSVEIDGRLVRSDIGNVATQLFGYYLIWGVLVAALSLAICLAGLWLAWRPRDQSPPEPVPPGHR